MGSLSLLLALALQSNGHVRVRDVAQDAGVCIHQVVRGYDADGKNAKAPHV